ncbi:MAG: hypothetical protein HPY66_1690 [Firmicutes bacterium]|nr:hypothetical protein [Bacillota bacterium]
MERIYAPASLYDVYDSLPPTGGKISISYDCEYNFYTKDKEGKGRQRERLARIVQKDENHFTVELIAQNRIGFRGSYRLSFLYVDILTGRVKMTGVN